MKTKYIQNFWLCLTILLGGVGTTIAQDDCASAINIPNLDGTGCPVVASSGTNFLAAGPCEDGTLDTWFQFTAQGGTADVTVTGPGSFRPEYLIISSSDTTCSGTLFLEDCVDGAGNYASISGTTNGLIPGDTYWIVVSSHNNSAGNVTVCVDNPLVVANCVDNEECDDAEIIALNAVGGAAACVTDCNNGATPGLDFVGNGCEDQLNPAVWYQFTTGATAATIDISMTSGDLSEPEFTLFLGDACAGPWTIVNCTEGLGGTATANNVPIAANTAYTIVVSDVTGDEGDFNLCITQNPDNSACNTNNSLTVTATSLGSPLTGPYEPGEDVTFCYTVTDWQQFNCNYIGAFVPTFGDCWDASSFNGQGMPVNVTTPLTVNGIIQPCPPGPPCQWNACVGTPSGTWNWFPAGAAVYNVNGYYPAGTPMPAGWYFLSSYDPLTGNCAPDPTDPDNSYGDGNFPACGTNTFDYTVCFTLTVGDLSFCTAGTTDCSVSMKTFADGEFGAWNSVGCTADGANTVPNAMTCSSPLPAELTEFEGSYENGLVNLSWTTASEDNTSHFVVSHMSSSTDLKPIGSVEAAGNSQEELNYRFVHDKPHPGVNYYNLKTYDRDGKLKNHGYVAVSADFGYAFYDRSNKQIVLAYDSEVEIYSMDGKLVKSSKGTTKVDFDAQGIFLIRDLTTGSLQRVSTF